MCLNHVYLFIWSSSLNQYIIADVYKNDDEYVSTVFNDLKISLKEIY